MALKSMKVFAGRIGKGRTTLILIGLLRTTLFLIVANRPIIIRKEIEYELRSQAVTHAVAEKGQSGDWPFGWVAVQA